MGELTEAFYDEGFDLALETCGYFDFDRLAPTLRKMNLIFMDLKHIDPEQHRRYTGVDNVRILENLQKTAALGLPLVVRIPVILGVNGDDQTLTQSFRFLAQQVPAPAWSCCPITALERKNTASWASPLPDKTFGIPTQDQMDRWRKMAEEFGLTVVSYR